MRPDRPAPITISAHSSRSRKPRTGDVLLLQHTHNHAARLVTPASDYADVYEANSPTALMKVFTGYLEPPGHGSQVESSAEYLAEDRNMAGIARLLESDGLPPPADMRT